MADLDKIIKDIKERDQAEKKHLIEMAKFENELLESLIAQIKRDEKVIQEYSFFGAIAGIFKQLIGGIFDQWKENFLSSFDSHSSTGNSTVSTYSKAAGTEAKTLETLDPENNPKDLVIWGISQMTVHEGAEGPFKKIKGFLNGLGSLKSPIPDASDEESQKEWDKGGAAIKILEDVAKAGGVAKGDAEAVSKVMPKGWTDVVTQMDDMTADYYAGKETATIVDVLEAIKLYCEAFSSTNYAKALDGAAKTAEEYEWADRDIDSGSILGEANEVAGIVTSQITRLNAAKTEIEAKLKEKGIMDSAGKITADAEKMAAGEGSTESAGKGQFESRIRNAKFEDQLLNSLLSEIRSHRS